MKYVIKLFFVAKLLLKAEFMLIYYIVYVQVYMLIYTSNIQTTLFVN